MARDRVRDGSGNPFLANPERFAKKIATDSPTSLRNKPDIYYIISATRARPTILTSVNTY